jgi:tRNA(fMet)-specific endonuclease VapC
MRYLLDTCVCSDFARGDGSTLGHIREVPPDDLAITTITEMEIAYGLRLNPRMARAG